nr:unnamed protein product [Callosobruchus analis]
MTGILSVEALVYSDFTMEPCAPGTEDDGPIMYSTLTKQEKEIERILSQKAFLKDGSYGKVFQPENRETYGIDSYYCRHTYNLQTCNYKNKAVQEDLEDMSRREDNEETTDRMTIDVAPGEPLPPGFENEERLDGFKAGPLVALEYLLELQDYDPSKEPVYLCILCDKRGDPRTVLTHLASYHHISQYLQRHFPTSWRALTPYMTTKQYKRNWQAALQKIGEGIEKKFGRLKPMPIDKDKFEKDRMVYLNKISKGKHFSEHGPTVPVASEWVAIQKPFKKRSPSPPVVNAPKKGKNSSATTASASSAATITNTQQKPAYKYGGPGGKERPLRRRSLSSVSSGSDGGVGDGVGRGFYGGRRGGRGAWRGRGGGFRGGFGRNRSPAFRRRRSPSPPLRRRSRSPRGISPSPRWRSPRSRRSPSPRRQRRDDPFKRQMEEEEKEKEREKEKLRKLEEFKKLSRAIENDMANVLKQHEKNPEKHPNYNEEWKKFWNRRYKELQAAGVDASKYDFKPEWIEFWNRRMVELHGEELKAKKEALRKRIGVMPNTPMAALPDQDNEVIVIEDSKDDVDRKRANSPWEQENVRPSVHKRSPKEREWFGRGPPREERGFRENRSRERSVRFDPPPMMRDARPNPMMMRDARPHPDPMMLPPEEEEDDGEINVVDVLRILTALEDKLGSLGPKVIDLLAQALALEKKEANSSETLLDNDINCVIFETVKEKLKGQLLAGLVDLVQERAFKKAIKKTAGLLHLASERKKKRLRTVPKTKPVAVPGLSGGGSNSKSDEKPITPKREPVLDLDKLTEPLTPSPERNSLGNMENLSDSDLQTLLQNFKDLSTDEQHNLINYLKKMELQEPERVEKLRQYVNLEPSKKDDEDSKSKSSDRRSPFLNRLAGVNPGSEDLIDIASDDDMEETQKEDKKSRENADSSVKKVVSLDSDEEDYSFEDVVKSVSKTVKAKETETNKKIVEETMKFASDKLKADTDLSNAKDLISNLMSNISKSNASDKVDLLGLGQYQPAANSNVSNLLSSTDLTETLGNINMSNLASIMNSVKNFPAQQEQHNSQQTFKYEPSPNRESPDRRMGGFGEPGGPMGQRPMGMGARGPIRPLLGDRPNPGGFGPNNPSGFGPNSHGGFGPNSHGGFGPNNHGGFGPNNLGGFPQRAPFPRPQGGFGGGQQQFSRGPRPMEPRMNHPRFGGYGNRREAERRLENADSSAKKVVSLDSDEEDYSFEDVEKSLKRKRRKLTKKIVEETMKFASDKLKVDTDLSNAKDFISNQVSSISKSNTSDKVDLLGLGLYQPAANNNVSNLLSSTDLTETSGNINMSNLASITNSVKNFPAQQEQHNSQQTFKYEPSPNRESPDRRMGGFGEPGGAMGQRPMGMGARAPIRPLLGDKPNPGEFGPINLSGFEPNSHGGFGPSNHGEFGPNNHGQFGPNNPGGFPQSTISWSLE